LIFALLEMFIFFYSIFTIFGTLKKYCPGSAGSYPYREHAAPAKVSFHPLPVRGKNSRGYISLDSPGKTTPVHPAGSGIIRKVL